MAIQPSDFLSTASSIVGNQSSLEVDLRNAVSRAYYAAYHTFEPHIKVRDFPRCGAHESLIQTLLEDYDEDMSVLALQLRKCKLRRHKADYDLTANIYIGVARQVHQECQNILAASDIIASAKPTTKP